MTYTKRLKKQEQKERKLRNKNEPKKDEPQENKDVNPNVDNPDVKPVEGNPDQPVVNNPEQEEEDEEKGPIELKEYKTLEKRYVLCLDNLGEDREYSVDEMKLIMDTHSLIKSSWEKQERTMLLKDRDTRLGMIDVETRYKNNVSLL